MNKRSLIVPLLFFIVFSITLGYAYLSKNLTINGSHSISSNTWDVRFQNIANKKGVTPTSNPTITDNTNISFAINFTNPGDYYEFTVDIVNLGSIDAMVNVINKSTLIEEQSKYLEYTVTYDNEVLSPIEKELLLPGLANKKTLLFKIKYKDVKTLNNEDLPSTNETINLSYSIEYVVAKDAIIQKLNMLRRFTYDDTYAYKNTTYRDNIVSITMLNHIDIPEEALISWDVSVNSDESVMAYVLTNSEDNTKYDLYIAGEGGVYANHDSSYLFANLIGLETINNIDYLNTSKVINMSHMFYYAGQFATTWYIGNLSNWNTSSVTNMSHMFDCTGFNATTWNIGDLSSWSTSKVIDMSYMFTNAGAYATTWNIGDLSSWSTSKVTDMSYMFFCAGNNTTTWNIGDLSSWNTSSVTNVSHMFEAAGFNATTWNIGDLSSWNTSSVINMSSMFSGAGRYATNKVDPNVRGWDVSLVTSYRYFNSNASWITPPTWVN